VTTDASAAPHHDQRDRLALALDVDDLVVALRLAARVRPWFGVAKVGLELFAAAGPEAVVALGAEGYRVFLDLKLHDIPTTVGRAARVIGGLGVAYTTVHTAGGEAMVRSAVDGMAEGAAAAGVPAPCVLGVTVLTSEVDAPTQLLRDRAALAAAAGCGGVVCAASDLSEIRRAAPRLVTVVPGIRPAGVSADDQARAADPGAAVRAGADILVIGRAVTGADDPEAAAAAIADLVGLADKARG
jgi:orotidine-5'-phosphate decarboxylase